MISYSLKCENGHVFDSWFQSAAAFDTLRDGGHVTCAVCGSGSVDKALMAPLVVSGRKKATKDAEVTAPDHGATRRPMVATPDPEMTRKLAEMKRQVEANSDYVGRDFAREARSMHLGDAPERSIYGEANAAEAKALVEDGVPVLPLPFTPTRKTN